VDKLRTDAQEATGLYEGVYLWLKSFLGFEPRLIVSKARFAGKFRHVSKVVMPWGVRAVPRLCLLCPGIRLTTKEKARNKSQYSRKFQLGTIHCVDMATFWQVATTRLSIPVPHGTLYKTRVNTPPA